MTVNPKDVNTDLQFHIALELYSPEARRLSDNNVLATKHSNSEIAVPPQSPAPEASPINNPTYWFGATGVILAIAFLLRVLLPVMLQRNKD